MPERHFLRIGGLFVLELLCRPICHFSWGLCVHELQSWEVLGHLRRVGVDRLLKLRGGEFCFGRSFRLYELLCGPVYRHDRCHRLHELRGG